MLDPRVDLDVKDPLDQLEHEEVAVRLVDKVVVDHKVDQDPQDHVEPLVRWDQLDPLDFPDAQETLDDQVPVDPVDNKDH